MITLFNIIVIGLVLLIAYWWANQGLFSALLHLVCVVMAGAVALGLWEPLVVGLLLRDSGADPFVWGATLVGVFAVTLFVLRVLADRMIRSNVDLPHWANLSFGFPVGAAAGVLTIGLLFIGCGFVQSHQQVLGYQGYGRHQRGNVVKMEDAMWLPVHQITAEFYSWLSVTSMLSPQPMRSYYPQLHRQASLVRDTFHDGQGEVSMPPDSATVREYYWAAGGPAAVRVTFGPAALDFGEQLTVANSQVRLISNARGRAKADVAYPDKWMQGGLVFLFDNFTHYATSTPGQEEADLTFIFSSLPASFEPRYVQIKGNRYRLPQPQVPPANLLEGGLPAGRRTVSAPPVAAGAAAITEECIKVSNDIRPIRASINTMPGTMTVEDLHLVEGAASFTGGRGSLIARNLQIKGIKEPEGTRIVKVDVSRDCPSNLFAEWVHEQAGPGSQIRMVDSAGNSYSPLGYLYDKGTGEYDIKLAPGQFLRTFDQIPYLPTAGTQRLQLIFRVTEGVTLVGLMYGDVTVASCNVEIPVKL
jgi:hypothetical protein